MSENLSLIPRFNLGSSHAMDANKLGLKSESSYTPPETGDKFSKYLEKAPKDKSLHSEPKTEPHQYQKKIEHTEPQKAQDPSDKTEVTKDVETVLNDPDLSIEEKIDALADLPEFMDLPFDEKVDMLATLMEDMPELKESFSAFLYQDEVPFETTALDDETSLDETEEAALDALEDNTLPQEVVAILQHIFKPDDKGIHLENDTHILENAQGTAIAHQALSLSTDTVPNPIGNLLEGTETIDENAIIEEPIMDEALLQKIEQVSAPQTSKENAPSLLDKADNASLSGFNTDNISGQQLNNTQNNIQRSNIEFKIATIPLKDNISMVITKVPESPNKIGINLEPAGMGEAELVIETKDNVVTAVVRSDKADVLDMIRKETASLERHLKEAGIDLGGGNLQFEQQDSNENQNENAEKTTISAGFEDTAPMTHGTPSTPQTIYQTLSSLDLSKGVDVRL